MQKKLIALAVAGLVSGAAFAADANLTISGIADVGYQYSGNSIIDNVKAQSAINDGGQDSSRVRFQGTEDMGNGLSAFFDLQQKFVLDNPAASPSGRNSNVGLKGSWGTLKLGSFGSVHDDYNGYSESGGMGWGNGVVHKLGTGDAYNAAEYISPNMSGLEFKLGLSTGYNAVEGEANSSLNVNKNNRAIFGAVAYANGPIKAALTYDRSSYQVEATGTNSASEWMGAFSYDFGVVRAGLGYDKTTYGNDDVRATWRVTAAAPITANDTVGISYSRGKYDFDAAGATDAKAAGWGVSYSHAMSKRTNVYATYGQMNQNDAADAAYVASATTNASFLISGSYQRAFKVGLRHFF